MLNLISICITKTLSSIPADGVGADSAFKLLDRPHHFVLYKSTFPHIAKLLNL